MSYINRVWRAIVGGPEPAPAKPQADTRPVRRISARYDAADTGTENRNHWAAADSLGPRSANSVDVRQKLRERARYECDNNGYAGGMVEGRANDCIGTGPRLQLSLPETWTDPDFGTSMTTTPPDAARLVELRFCEWADAIGLADKLHLFDESQTRDGELFGVETNNPNLDGVQLDLQLYESEQCCTPDLDPFDPNAVDGIIFDKAGNPVAYNFLRQHPGEQTWGAWLQEYDTVPADVVYHFFRKRRAGQARGVPDITAALPLYAVQRRYTLAVLHAAESAAMVAGVITSDLPADGGDPPEIDAMDPVPMARNVWLTMPAGQDAKTFEPSQPAQSYREFKGEIHTEAGQTVRMPGVLATGDYSQVNYSSGRLARIPYQGSILIRRDRIRRVILDRLFRSWLREALAIPDYLPAGLPPLSLWQWRWRWDGFVSIDPVKDATANEIALRSGQTTLERICAENGDDWEEVLEQQAREMKKRGELGLPAPDAATHAPAPQQFDENGDPIPTDQTSQSGGAETAVGRAATGGANVQGTALNGAQIASLVLVCDKLSLDLYPAQAVEDMLKATFPVMDRDLIHSFVTALDKHPRPKLQVMDATTKKATRVEEPANA